MLRVHLRIKPQLVHNGRKAEEPANTHGSEQEPVEFVDAPFGMHRTEPRKPTRSREWRRVRGARGERGELVLLCIIGRVPCGQRGRRRLPPCNTRREAQPSALRVLKRPPWVVPQSMHLWRVRAAQPGKKPRRSVLRFVWLDGSLRGR